MKKICENCAFVKKDGGCFKDGLRGFKAGDVVDTCEMKEPISRFSDYIRKTVKKKEDENAVPEK